MTHSLQQIETQMLYAISMMFASGRVAIEDDEELVPLVHFYPFEGREEIVGFNMDQTDEHKDAFAKFIKDKLASNLYGGVLIRTQVMRTNFDDQGNFKDASNAICVSYETPLESLTYTLPYVKVGDEYLFGEIYKSEVPVAGRLKELFPRPHQA